MNDVVLNKKESIERCVKQVRLYYNKASDLPFEDDFYKQDAIAINLQRIAEIAIDMANHIVKTKKLGIPKSSRDSFDLLKSEKIIPDDLATKLKGMVGFRNLLVHDYQRLDIGIMKRVIESGMDDILEYTNILLQVDTAS